MGCNSSSLPLTSTAVWEEISLHVLKNYPDSKVHGASMGPIWGRQDPDGPHVGPMNFAIWVGNISQGTAYVRIRNMCMFRHLMVLAGCGVYPHISLLATDQHCIFTRIAHKGVWWIQCKLTRTLRIWTKLRFTVGNKSVTFYINVHAALW